MSWEGKESLIRRSNDKTTSGEKVEKVEKKLRKKKKVTYNLCGFKNGSYTGCRDMLSVKRKKINKYINK